MKKIIIITLISFFASACVSTKNIAIDSQHVKTYKGKSLTTTTREVPDFAAMTAGKAMFGLLGAAAMISAGNALIKEHEIEDPADYIKDILANDFASHYAMQYQASADKILTSEKTSQIVKLYSGFDYLIDVRTINWSFVYYPTKWNIYRVIYSVKLKLIDAKTGATKAEGFCSRVPENPEEAASRDEMLANNAAVIKSELRLAANKCINEFKEKVLSLPTTKLEQLVIEESNEIINTIIDDDNVSETNDLVVTQEQIEGSEYKDIIIDLYSNNSLEMRLAAIKIGKEKLFSKELILLASMDVLDQAAKQSIIKKDKHFIDGLSWCALNLGNSHDVRAKKILRNVVSSTLPSKVKKHAAKALKKIK